MKLRTITLGLLASVVSCLPGRPTLANEGSASLFVRSDSDQTTVVSPHATVSTRFNEDRTQVDVGYMADIWTSASIDVRTAATKPVTEQRDQLDVTASHDLDDLTLGTAYYFSAENDYDAHGGSVFSVQELAGGSFTIEERASVGHHIIGRSGDPSFERHQTTLGLRIAATQIIDPKTLVQGVYELQHAEGYQSSPYRFVGMGGDGQCGGSATFCLPEAHPELRTRHALAVQARRAMSDDSSVGLGYRFYVDDWGIVSHTALAQIAWLPAADQTLTLRYRFYQQGGANFYRPVYPEPGPNLRYMTSDKELSPLFSNRLALGYQAHFDLGEVGLSFALAVGGTVFSYKNFPNMSDVYAGDATVALTLEL